MTLPIYWKDAQKYLSKKDRRLKRLIENYSGEWMMHLGNPFHTLARSIVGQQISVKAADSVWNKLHALMELMEPHVLERHHDEALRACGLSQSKIRYLRNIADAFLSGHLTPDIWQNMDDAEVTKQLTAITGVGQWTAEMFMIFHLHRPDIWPIGDIGIVKGVEKLVAARHKLSKEELIAIAEPWRPYRTVAAWYLWRSLDPVPVQY